MGGLETHERQHPNDSHDALEPRRPGCGAHQRSRLILHRSRGEKFGQNAHSWNEGIRNPTRRHPAQVGQTSIAREGKVDARRAWDFMLAAEVEQTNQVFVDS
jgi:hypothetical protein